VCVTCGKMVEPIVSQFGAVCCRPKEPRLDRGRDPPTGMGTLEGDVSLAS